MNIEILEEPVVPIKTSSSPKTNDVGHNSKQEGSLVGCVNKKNKIYSGSYLDNFG